MSIRTERVGVEIKKALSEAIRGVSGDISKGLITVTAVRMSPDLQYANIYISVMAGNKPMDEVIEILGHKAGYLCREVCNKIRIRKAPKFRFFHDDTLDQIEHIQDLIDSTK